MLTLKKKAAGSSVKSVVFLSPDTMLCLGDNEMNKKYLKCW
jgi:hypothetical protein